MASASASPQTHSGHASPASQESSAEYAPRKDYVMLETKDDHCIYLPRDLAEVSPQLQDMMRNPNPEGQPFNVVGVKNLDPQIVCKTVEYFAYKKKYMDTNKEVPLFPIKNDEAIEVLLAANFLQC